MTELIIIAIIIGSLIAWTCILLHLVNLLSHEDNTISEPQCNRTVSEVHSEARTEEMEHVQVDADNVPYSDSALAHIEYVKQLSRNVHDLSYQRDREYPSRLDALIAHQSRVMEQHYLGVIADQLFDQVSISSESRKLNQQYDNTNRVELHNASDLVRCSSDNTPTTEPHPAYITDITCNQEADV